MRVNKFDVPIYNWRVLFIIFDDNDTDTELCRPKVKAIGLPMDMLDEEISGMNNECDGGGVILYNAEAKVCCILIYKAKLLGNMVATIGHEGRHLTDVILQTAGVKDDEAAGYLAGFIFKQLYKEFKL